MYKNNTKSFTNTKEFIEVKPLAHHLKFPLLLFSFQFMPNIARFNSDINTHSSIWVEWTLKTFNIWKWLIISHMLVN